MKKKRYDWASRMFDTIEKYRAEPFAWGQHDCCLFVARVVDAMLDENFEQQLRSLYTDERSARKLIAAHGGLREAVTIFLGEPSTGQAWRGDVVIVAGEDGDVLGICLGSTVVGLGPHGVLTVPRTAIKEVWAIG